MHRSFTIILAVLLIVALAIPVFASELNYNEHVLPEVPYIDGFETVILHSSASNTYTTVSFRKGSNLFFDVSSGFYKVSISEYMQSVGLYVDPVFYTLTDTSWALQKDLRGIGASNTTLKIWKNGNYSDEAYSLVFSTVNYSDKDGSSVAGVPLPGTYCNGTTCPATDVNHDNICDDCGKVLTMSLRSSLLDFARNIAETNDKGYNYWAIFQLDDQYRVYVSSTPMTGRSLDNTQLTGTDLTYALAYELSNGSFSYGSWYEGFHTEMTFIESNHTIENFGSPPLAVIIQGVTGEALELTLPNLMNQVKTILFSAVLCLALLISLVLLRRSLKIFRIG